MYEARRDNQGVRPKPVPSQPDQAAWTVVGTQTPPPPGRSSTTTTTG
ncbi:MAG: hypothetical protein AB7O78_07885 [Thermoleophilia bacterium]